jgi:hypothetical protein
MSFKSLFLILPFLLISSIQTTDIENARSYYKKASSDKKQAELLEKLCKDKENITLKSYYGVSQCIMASHHWNPYEKLSLLNKGLGILNNSIKQDSKNIEIRILRLSVETKIPSIVSFKSHIEEDTEWIKKNFDAKHPIADVAKMLIPELKNKSIN